MTPQSESNDQGMTLIESVLGCSRDEAQRIQEVLGEQNITTVDQAVVVGEQGTGRWIEVQADGSGYWLFVTSRNFLETIRRDSQDGETIYQVYY